MRRLLLGPILLVLGCGPGEEAGGAPSPGSIPRLEALRLAPGMVLQVDGSIAEDAWSRASELRVPLSGKGPAEVVLKAAHDGKRLYLLAVWSDPSRSLGRYYRYEGNLKWSRFATEDGFSVCWAPGSRSGEFRAQGCAMTCHGGRHVLPGPGSGFFDFWYWGAQQTNFHPQARDLWLRQGDEHRLRGDRQPAESDNLPNLSTKYEGPCLFPTFRRKGDDRALLAGQPVKEVTPEWITRYWNDEINVGREVPLDLLGARLGSRGDVAGAAHHHEGRAWTLEMARDLDTGNPDDLPLGDPLFPALFAIAVHDDAAGEDHAVSGPIELRLMSAP